MTHDPDHDPEFEAFLRRRSPMHRRLSQIDHAEPSAELDRVVLERARDAIGMPAQEPIYRKSRWAMPVALAATILIAFTVVLNIDHRRTGSLNQHASNASARLADAPAAVPSSQLMERARAEEAGAEGADMSAPESASTAAAPPPALARDASAAERRQQEEQKRVAKAEVSSAGPSKPAPATAEPSSEQPALAARAFTESRAEAESDDDASFPDAATGNAAEIVTQRDRSLASHRSVMPGATAGASPAAPAPRAAAGAQATDVHASPEAWLREINRLRAEGKNEEADRELAAFRRAHPAHPGYSLAQPPTR